jgi:hypothetical protein
MIVFPQPQIKVKAEVREVAGSARLPCTACVIHCRAYTRVSHQASGLLWPHLPALMPRFTLQPVIRIVWTLNLLLRTKVDGPTLSYLRVWTISNKTPWLVDRYSLGLLWSAQTDA